MNWLERINEERARCMNLLDKFRPFFNKVEDPEIKRNLERAQEDMAQGLVLHGMFLERIAIKHKFFFDEFQGPEELNMILGVAGKLTSMIASKLDTSLSKEASKLLNFFLGISFETRCARITRAWDLRGEQ